MSASAGSRPTWSVDGASVGDGEYLGGASYLDVEPGTHTVTATQAADDTPVAELDVSIEAGASVTVVLYGASKTSALAELDDDLSPLLPDGRRTRVMHVADGLGEVDLWTRSTLTSRSSRT